MSQSHNPARWLEDDQLAPDLRDQLASYAAEAPHVERRARMLASLEQQLGFGEAPSVQSPGAQGAQPALGGATGTGTAGAAGTVFKLKLVIGMLATLGASLGLFAGWSAARSAPATASSQHGAQDVSARSTFRAAPSELARWVPEVTSHEPERERTDDVSDATATVHADDEPPPQPPRARKAKLVSRHVVTVAPSGRAESPAPGDAAGAAVPSRADPASVVPSSTDPASALAASTHPPSAVGATGALSELTLLAHARRALLVHPERSLELAEQHAREYPNGTLCEEREVLAIESLLKLGLGDRARQRALLFGQRFPSSAHRAHLARMIALPAH